MSQHTPAPIRTVPFITRGTVVLLVLIGLGLIAGGIRFALGIGGVTNLDDQYPWGISIAIDVASGVALAAGGFTTSALAYIFHRHNYHAIVRPALLTAMLGYTFVSIGLMFDLGRFYNIWHPLVYWQGNSVLFEVGICVVTYLHVLYLEFLPIVVERFKDGITLPGPLAGLGKPLHRLLMASGTVVDKFLFVLIIMGVVLSCMHQSSLGTLMLIAPTKMHALWFTPILPVIFLMSAICVGYPMVIVESMAASRAFKLEPETHILSDLARFTPVFLLMLLTMKVTDLFIRGVHPLLLEGSPAAWAWLAENGLGIALPMLLLFMPHVRSHPARLLTAAALVVGGVVLSRVNVFLVAYTPPYADYHYVPALGEVAITVGLIATLILLYRIAVMNFPIIAGRARA